MAKRVARNVLFSGAFWLVPAVAALIAVPITVRGLGDDGYGVMALVGALTGYLGVLDLGMSHGIVRYVAMQATKREGRSMRQTLRAVTVWFAAVGVGGALAMWALAPWFVEHLFDIPAALTAESVTAFRLGGLSFVVAMLSTVYALVPEAFLRYDISATLNGLLATASLAGPAVIVSLGYGLVEVMWFAVALGFVALVVWLAIAVRMIAPLPDEGPPFSEFRREFIGFAMATGTNRVWSVLSKQTARAVIGVAGGSAQVAYYQVPSQISDRVTQLLSRTSRVLLPAGSQLAAEGEHEALLTLYLRASRLFFLLNAAAAGAVCAFAAPLLEHWIGPQYAESGAMALVFLVLASALNATSMQASRMNLALGRPKVNLAFSVANSVVHLGLVYFLTVAWGITGTALSGLVAAGVVPLFIHYSHRNILEVGTWRVFRECYLGTTASVALVSALAWYLLAPLGSSLLGTLVLVMVTGALALGVAALVGGTRREDWRTLRDAFRREPAPEGGGVGA